MKWTNFIIILGLMLLSCSRNINTTSIRKTIKLPEPNYESNISIEEVLLERKSIRRFKEDPLSLKELSQLLWSAQGIDATTHATRTAPSAGATYPLELYVVVYNVKGLTTGIYHYNPKTHTLNLLSTQTPRNLFNAPLFIIFTAVFRKTTKVYGEDGIKYVYIEVGHAAQNLHLQATALNLGTFVIGAFDKKKLQKLLNLPINHEPIYIMPVGKY